MRIAEKRPQTWAGGAKTETTCITSIPAISEKYNPQTDKEYDIFFFAFWEGVRAGRRLERREVLAMLDDLGEVASCG